MKKLPPLSLYIHIPWCLKKCLYCDFNSIKLNTTLPQKKYIENLIHDFEKDIHLVANRTIQSIFIGGGTPSLISPNHINTLLIAIKKKLNFLKT